MISRLKIIIADDNKIITTVLAEEIKKQVYSLPLKMA